MPKLTENPANYLDIIEQTVKDVYAPLYQHVFEEVAFGELIRRKTRKREIMFGRQLVYYFMRNYTLCSLKSIGASLGFNQDHSTVLNAVHMIANARKYEKKTRIIVEEIETRLMLNHGFIHNTLNIIDDDGVIFSPINKPQFMFLTC